jgi:hypothetical protein
MGREGATLREALEARASSSPSGVCVREARVREAHTREAHIREER